MEKLAKLLILQLAFTSCLESQNPHVAYLVPSGANGGAALDLIASLVKPQAGTYSSTSEKLSFQLNFQSEINVSPSSRLILSVGMNTRYASYVSGSGTSSLVFSYQPQVTDQDLDGINFSITSINIPSGNLTRVSDNKIVSPNFSSLDTSLTNILIDNTTGITPPNQVTGVVTAPTTSNTSLAISWEVPGNNGTNISHYHIQYREQGKTQWINHSSTPNYNSALLSGLSSGTTYEIKVAANNGLVGAYSAITTVEIFDISLLNPIAWLSATNITNGGTEPSHGDNISTWKDLTGVAGNATEGVVGKQPVYHSNVTNGLPSVRFTNHALGLEGSFTRVNNDGMSIYLVARMDSNNSRECIFEFYSNSSSPRAPFFNYGMNEVNTNYNLDDTQFNLWFAYDNGSKTDFFENAQVIYQGKNNYQNTDLAGSWSYVLGDDKTGGDEFNGYISEIVIFDQELSISQKEKMADYLKNKWNLP